MTTIKPPQSFRDQIGEWLYVMRWTTNKSREASPVLFVARAIFSAVQGLFIILRCVAIWWGVDWLMVALEAPQQSETDADSAGAAGRGPIGGGDYRETDCLLARFTSGISPRTASKTRIHYQILGTRLGGNRSRGRTKAAGEPALTRLHRLWGDGFDIRLHFPRRAGGRASNSLYPNRLANLCGRGGPAGRASRQMADSAEEEISG